MDIYELDRGEFLGSIDDGRAILCKTDKEIGLYNVISTNGQYYAVCTLGYNPSIAGVRKIEFDLDKESEIYENEIICPVCGHIDNDSWEVTESKDEYQCGVCGAKLSVDINVSVTYDTNVIERPEIIHID